MIRSATLLQIFTASIQKGTYQTKYNYEVLTCWSIQVVPTDICPELCCRYLKGIGKLDNVMILGKGSDWNEWKF